MVNHQMAALSVPDRFGCTLFTNTLVKRTIRAIPPKKRGSNACMDISLARYEAISTSRG